MRVLQPSLTQVGEFGMPDQQGMAKGIRSAIKLSTPLIFWFTSSFPAVSGRCLAATQGR